MVEVVTRLSHHEPPAKRATEVMQDTCAVGRCQITAPQLLGEHTDDLVQQGSVSTRRPIMLIE
ncbi:hypothetical protein ACTMTJ_42535 [Phytohabitans sp. LJ34]